MARWDEVMVSLSLYSFSFSWSMKEWMLVADWACPRELSPVSLLLLSGTISLAAGTLAVRS